MPTAGDIMRGVVVGLVSIIVLSGAVLHSVKGPGITPMNFIETLFGFSPDNGDGSLEIWLVVALAIFAADQCARLSKQASKVMEAKIRSVVTGWTIAVFRFRVGMAGYFLR